MRAIDEKEFTISVLDVMRLMQQAWEIVQPKTISNCFRHADFCCTDTSNDATEATPEIDDDSEDDIPLAILAQLGLTTTTLQDYMIVDDSLPTSERLTDDDIISSRSTDSLDADDKFLRQ